MGLAATPKKAPRRRAYVFFTVEARGRCWRWGVAHPVGNECRGEPACRGPYETPHKPRGARNGLPEGVSGVLFFNR